MMLIFLCFLFTDSSALFLSGRSFDHPFDHLSQMETKRMVVNYLAYLHDNTQLIPSFIKVIFSH